MLADSGTHDVGLATWRRRRAAELDGDLRGVAGLGAVGCRRDRRGRAEPVAAEVLEVRACGRQRTASLAIDDLAVPVAARCCCW